MELGKIGAFVFMDAMSAQESIAFCRRIEKMGYKVVWSPEAWGREPFAHGSYLLANADSLIYATGIANIWVRDPVTMEASTKTLAEFAPNRFILGIRVSHRSLVADWRGHGYTKPFSYLSEYISKMKEALYKAVAPEVEPPLVLAALHPKSLGLAAREHLSFYASQENYQRILRAQGFSDTDFENGGSDRLIDTVVAWGSEEQIQDKIDAQLAAGASHVCLMPLRCDDNSLPDERALEAFAPR